MTYSSDAKILSISFPVITKDSDFVKAYSNGIFSSFMISLTVLGSVKILHVFATFVAIFY